MQGAAEMGLKFSARNFSNLQVENQAGQTNANESFKVLAEFPFDSTRKCMSVLVKDDLTNQYYLYTKGADNIMLDKISFTKSPYNYKASIIEDLHSYSCEGYRTLVIAMRRVPVQEFVKFENIH